MYIKPKWRGCVLIPVWLVAVFYLTNIWHWRFFNDMMPLASYCFWSNINDTVVNTWLLLIKPVDIALIAPAAIATVAYYAYFRKRITTEGGYTRPCKFTTSLCTLAFYLITSHLYPIYKSVNSEDAASDVKSATFTQKAKSRWTKEWVTRYPDYVELNLTGYLAKQAFFEIYHRLRSREVSEEQIAMIGEYFDEQARLIDKGYAADTDKVETPRKNLILVIVESLNSWVVNFKVNGREVTPTLNSLIREEGTVSALDVVTQVLSGVSSDGQFIYNTGMLPSTEVTTVYYYDKNQYPSLAKTFGDKYSFEAICESAIQWNHRGTTIAYGYDTLIDDIRHKVPGKGNDGALFSYASEVIDTLTRPFFAELTTLSMHGPYKDAAVSRPKWIAEAQGLTEMMRDYLTVTNYFDTELGLFIHHLKQQGVYDDTMLVIASDHASRVEGAGKDENSARRIVFIAANTPVTSKIDRTVGQIDVYPTILDLMGESQNMWHGIGLSMFNSNCYGAIDKEGKCCGQGLSNDYLNHLKKAHSVCNTMLRMDYFRSFPNRM